MENTIHITDKNAYGIPENRIMEIGGRWIPIGNKKFWTNNRRHHYQTCPECGEKKKNIRLHYKLYHPKFWHNFFIKPFMKGQIGQLYGVRFVTTSK